MEKDSVFEKVAEIARDTFDDECDPISMETSRDSVEDWNSLGHIRLLTEIEEEFGVDFSIDEISKIDSIGQIVDLILQKND